MIGQTISHYKILDKPPTASRKIGTSSGQVGEGGMGVVYKAQHLKLDRLNWFESSPKGIDIPTEGSLPANLDGGRPRIQPL
jgi:hypothetical protein